MGTLTNTIESINSGPQPGKRKKSIVWDYFTLATTPECTRAVCKQCKKSFAYITGSKLAGTSHLKRHISLDICPANRPRNQENNMLSIDTPDAKTNISANVAGRARKRCRATPGFTSLVFDQDHCNHDIAKMIIQHDYPLHIVENTDFISFVRSLQPQFSLVNISTIEEHVKGIYLRTKQSLSDLFAEIPGRISLTLDLLVSNQSLGYVFLTGHFVDCDWKLQRRMLNVITLPYPDSEDAFNHAVSASLTDWNFENRIFTLTLDNPFINESVKENLRGLMSISNPLILNGQLILNNCYTRTFRDLAQDALMMCRETVEKVRLSVLYVKTSAVREHKFIELKQQLQVPSMKNLILDDLTKWDTTYHMLMSASELKEVFSCLDTSDPEYTLTLSMEEWKQVETLCVYLCHFYDAVNILTAPVYPTSNIFFDEVWKIHLELMHGTVSEDPLVCYITKPLLEKFERYWRDCGLFLAAAVMMDPRFKMKLVEFSFNRIYGADAETWIKIVEEGVHELFLEYVVQSLPAPTFVEDPHESLERTDIDQDDSFLSPTDGLTDFDVYIGFMNSQHTKSELDQYLEESLLPRVQDFDVLGWWRINSCKYPTLSKMASDILCIPVSTVSPDSVFDTGIRKVDSYRGSLHPNTHEALVCAKDWLQYGISESSSESLSGSPSAIVKKEREY
ncbi:hypothetical protein LIER_07576 [Lithospermum erythrorhizon]|uniref:BED-type domain-containing protein n=1 Tax=Lithospermum erythrorhizon TaxID=34254 RepID=A0AAV3PBI2_LITER